MVAAVLVSMRTSVLLAVLWSLPAVAAPPRATPPAAPAQPPAVAAPQATAPASLTTIDVDAAPEPCRDLAKLAASPSRNAALSARISFATCLADQITKRIVLCDCEQSVIEVNAAIEPSLVLLDEVFAHGDAATQILARHAQGQMLSSFATRLLATVPPPATNTEEAVALRDTRLAMLQPHIQPWQSRAQAAYAELDKIARANPQLAKNAAVLAAVRATRDKLSQGVAKR